VTAGLQQRTTCPVPGCLDISDPAPRREGEDATLCARHRQQDRTRRGVCLNCGAPLVSTPEMNELTGRQLRRKGEPVYNLTCAEHCGYQRRTRPQRRPR
jgi:hypothetical protein